MKLKDLFKEWATNSSYMCLSKLIKSKNVVQLLLWILFNISSLALCCYYLMLLFSDYFSYSVVTTIQSIYQQPLEYPGVLICSLSFNNNFTKLITDCSIGYDTACQSNPDNYFQQTQNGYCYSFNSGYNMTNQPININNAIIGGYQDAFSIRFYSPGTTYIIIHDRYKVPEVLWKSLFLSNLFELKSGFTNYFALQKTVEKKLEQPYNYCFKDFTKFNRNLTIVNHFVAKNKGYRQISCLNLCFELKYIETDSCNCGNVLLGDLWQQCVLNSTLTISNCIIKKKLAFFQNEVLKLCSDYCPLECESTDYFVSSSVVSGESGSTNYIDVKIYYNSLKYNLVSQQASMTIINFVANIGGIIGLWVGLNFLSLFELFDLLIEMFSNFCKSHKVRT